MESGERLARDFPNFQRALDALAVGGGQARGGHWVYLRQLSVQRRPALLQSPRFDALAHVGIGSRHGVKAVHQRLEIQHGAADEQRQRAARANLGNQKGGVLHEGGGAVGLPGLADVNEMVRHRGALSGRGLGGANVHAAVDQRRIDADDFHRHRHRPGQALGEPQSGASLARGGGPGDS